jgi:hypothetical protein
MLGFSDVTIGISGRLQTWQNGQTTLPPEAEYPLFGGAKAAPGQERNWLMLLKNISMVGKY